MHSMVETMRINLGYLPMEKLSGQQHAVRSVEAFDSWIKDRDAAGDWLEYVRGDRLSRSEIAAECGFGTRG